MGDRDHEVFAEACGRCGFCDGSLRALKGSLWLMVPALVVAFVAWLGRPAGFPPESAAPSVDPYRVSEVMIGQWETPVLWVMGEDATAGTQSDGMREVVVVIPEQFEEGLAELLDKWTPGSRIVVDCGRLDCDAAVEVAGRLRAEVGLPDVYVLERKAP
ncbi:MAG: hypothetical protein JW706_11440 [Opitutales bacterium]|nr:hypothetical protein [Opitutales bacterium]